VFGRAHDRSIGCDLDDLRSRRAELVWQQLTRDIRLLGGISNLLNKKYYNRVFQNGIEPGARRKVYAGIAVGL